MKRNRLSLLFLLIPLFFVGVASANSICGTTPSGLSITSCIPISIQNTQSTALTANTQVMLTFNALNYSSYLASNLQNIVLYNISSGKTAPAWIEGNYSNENNANSLNKAANVIIWLKLPEALGASTTDTNWAIGVGSTSTNYYGNVISQIGIAPQLTSTYGEYDNGWNVFNEYWNFNGTSLPSTLNADGSVTINDGLIMSDGFVYTKSTFNDNSQIAEVYSQSINLGGFSTIYNYFEISNSNTVNSSTPRNWLNYGYSTGIFEYNPGVINLFCGINAGNHLGVIGMDWISTNSVLGSLNYSAGTCSIGGLTKNSTSYLSISTEYAGGSGTAATDTFDWLRIRTNPPNQIQPTFTSSGIQHYIPILNITPEIAFSNSSITIKATCMSGDTCSIDYPSLGTAIATGTGSATYTYSSNKLSPGIYKYYYAIDTITNTNSLAKNISIYFPIFVQNSTSNPANTFPFSTNNGPPVIKNKYPIKIFTNTTYSAIFSLNQSYNGGANIIEQKNVNNLNYIPPANQVSGNYVYYINESYNGNQLNVEINYTINMTDMNGQLTFNSLCNTLIQDTPNCALFPYGTNTFTSKPSSWYIQSDTGLSTYNGTGSKSNFIQFSNNNVTFTPKIILNYNQFSPTYSFQLNLTNNPKMQSSITQQSLTFVLSNTLLTGRRNLANFSIFSQDNFNALNDVNLSLRMSGLFNGYVISKTISNTTANASGKYFLSIPKSNYSNPNILLNINASVTKPLFYQQADTYCQANISDTQTNVYPIGLVDTNGSKYSMYVYSNGGNSAAGYLLEVLEQKGVGSTLVQSLTIPPSIPFPLPLESVGQQYAFDVYTPNCKTVLFKGAFSQPSNPTYITLSSLVPVYIVNKSAAVGSCKLNGYVNGLDNISCFGADSTNLAYSYKLDIYKTTTVAGTTQLVFSGNYTGNSFTANVLLPENTSYTGTIIALYNDAKNTGLILYSGVIIATVIQLATPLFGLLAFILFITLLLGAVSTGKAIIVVLFSDVAMFIISLTNLVNIQPSVFIIFMILGGIAIWWDKA